VPTGDVGGVEVVHTERVGLSKPRGAQVGDEHSSPRGTGEHKTSSRAACGSSYSMLGKINVMVTRISISTNQWADIKRRFAAGTPSTNDDPCAGFLSKVTTLAPGFKPNAVLWSSRVRLINEPPDLEALVAAFARYDVEYLLIGGAAAIIHGSKRSTVDIDVLARGGLENLTRLAGALNSLGAAGFRYQIPVDEADLRGINSRWETTAGQVDVLINAAGPNPDRKVTYRELHGDHVLADVAGLEIPVVSLPQLIMLKSAAGRRKDVAAVAELRTMLTTQKPPTPDDQSNNHDRSPRRD